MGELGKVQPQDLVTDHGRRQLVQSPVSALASADHHARTLVAERLSQSVEGVDRSLRGATAQELAAFGPQSTRWQDVEK